MEIENARAIIDIMKDEFDSHDFIKEYIWRNPVQYGELLGKHENVTRAHAEISKFLLNHSMTLRIEKTGEEGTDDIFGHIVPCAQWRKL